MKPFDKRLQLSFILLAAGLQIGCATYQSKVSEARNLMQNGESLVAAEKLEKFAAEPSDDQLVYVLDLATAYQTAGQYDKSSKVFEKADELTELKDYHSVSRIGGSLLFNEGMVQYKGEDFEKLLINVMSALNYAFLGDREKALVEVRRLNEKLEYFRLEEKKEYKQNTFALYLSAMLREADGDYDGAIIDYERAFKIDPDIPYLKEDLVRASQLSGREESFVKYKSRFGISPKKIWRDKNYGEVVLLYLQGWGPRKAPRPESPRFPMLVPEYSMTRKAELSVAGDQSETTQKIYDVERNAIRVMDEQYAALVAKRVTGVVAKEVVAQRVSKDNEALGAVLWIAMHASDQADLRQWSTLPESFQVARLRVPVGKHRISVRGLSISGDPTGENMPEIEVVVKPRTTTFVGWRSFR